MTSGRTIQVKWQVGLAAWRRKSEACKHAAVVKWCEVVKWHKGVLLAEAKWT